MRRLHWGPANCPITRVTEAPMKTITSAAIVGALCVRRPCRPAATDVTRVAPTAVMAPTTGPRAAVPTPWVPQRVQSSLRPATPVLSTVGLPAGRDKLVSESNGAVQATARGPNAAYKLRIGEVLTRQPLSQADAGDHMVVANVGHE